jgi:hypothetical protein
LFAKDKLEKMHEDISVKSEEEENIPEPLEPD